MIATAFQLPSKRSTLLDSSRLYSYKNILDSTDYGITACDGTRPCKSGQPGLQEGEEVSTWT